VQVPLDVAVEQPGARVVGLEGQQDEAVLRQVDCVAPRRVGSLDIDEVVEKEPAAACEHVRVVAVQVQRVRQRQERFDDDVHPVGALEMRQVDGVEVGCQVKISIVEHLLDDRVLHGRHIGGRSADLPPECQRVVLPGEQLSVEVLGDNRLADVVRDPGDQVREVLVAADVQHGPLLAGGPFGLGRRGGVVPHDAADVEGIEVDGEACQHGMGAHPVVGGLLVGLDDDVVTLADGDQQRLGLVGHDGDEVHGDDRHLVPIDGEPEGDLRARVNKPEEVLLALAEVELEARPAGAFPVLVLAVDQPAGRNGRDAEDLDYGP